jgi:hypothetical protein
MKTLALISITMLSGCALTPDQVFTNYDHVSHPLLGAPFNSKPEQYYDAIGVTARWERGHIFYEAGLAYKITPESLLGDECMFNGRVGYSIWSRR